MNRYESSRYRMQLTSIMIVVCVLIATFAQVCAGESKQGVQRESEFKILYHENLDFQFEGSATAESDSQFSESTQQQDPAAESTTLSFDAFGQHFELLLESNQALIAKLPEEQKQALNKELKIYRGRLQGNEKSWVRITRQDNRISGMIWDGNEIFVIDHSTDVTEALQQNTGTSDGYPLIYRLSDTESDGRRCALDPSAKPINDYQGLVRELQENTSSLPQATSQLDVAVIADTQFASMNSNPDAAVVARMNVVDGIFSEQVTVHLNLSEIRVLQNNGQLSSTSPGTLLDQLSDFSSSSSFNNPGLTHLFTGRNLSGSTIGIAYLDSLCSDRFGVGISETRGGGTAGALTVAHEIGHNFGAPHDNQSGSPCAGTPGNFIMNPSLNGSDQFSQCSLNQMQSAIRNAACLTDIDDTPAADVRPVAPQNPVRANVDQTFDLPVTVQNSGNTAAVNVSAEISIPTELTIEAAEVDEGTCTIATNVVNCDLDNIAGSASKTVNLNLQAAQSGNFETTVEVGADNDGNSSNNSVDIPITIANGDDTGLFEAHFDSDSEGFVYVDDAFRDTNQPDYADGSFTATGGFNGGALRVLVGGRDNADILEMSGGWERSFTLDNAQSVTLAFRYRFAQGRNYEADEFSDALVSVDGTLLQRDGVDYLTRFEGDGNGGPTQTADWQLVTFDLGQLEAGSHTIRIGVFNNKKTFSNEVSLILIDDVMVTGATAPVPPTAQCPDGARFASDGQGSNFCWFEELPVPQGAQSYCRYLGSHQTIGYYFDINLAAECPASARSASNGVNLNFCLFENIEVPEGARAECDELGSNRRIGFSFPQ